MDNIINETRNNSFSVAINQICRICLNSSDKLFSLFEDVRVTDDKSILLADLLVNCANIQLSKTQDFPNSLCTSCLEKAIISYKFRQQCEKSDSELRAGYLTKLQQNLTPKVKETNEDDSKHRTCPQCGKLFQQRCNMLKHHRKHTSPPKTCDYCNYQPVTLKDLMQHMDGHHFDKKTIICKICDKRFFREANLKTHLLIHSGVKRHTCEICGVSFTLSGNLVQHLRLHTGEKPYTCTHCGQGFTQHSTLRSHEVTHTDSKNFICSDCGMAFSRAAAMQKHQKRHLNIKPYVCTICGKAFIFSSDRKRHMITHTGVKNHVCDVCGKRFNRSSILNVHKRTHTGETPFVCEICGKGFTQAHCLRTHMNTHQVF